MAEQIVNEMIEDRVIEAKPLQEFKTAYDLMMKLSKNKKTGAAKAIAELPTPTPALIV